MPSREKTGRSKDRGTQEGIQNEEHRQSEARLIQSHSGFWKDIKVKNKSQTKMERRIYD